MAKKYKSTGSIRVLNNYNTSDQNNEDLYPFPNRDINPKKKTALYHKKWAEAIYAIFVSSRASWGIGEHDAFVKQRAYAIGRQSTDKYKAFLLEEQQSDSNAVASVDDMPISRVARREGWLNVLWDNFSIGPKLMDSMHGMFDALDFDLYVDAIDPQSLTIITD